MQWAQFEGLGNGPGRGAWRGPGLEGLEVVLLRGVEPHLHPLAESSKRGPGCARPRLLAELLSHWEVCDVKGLNKVLAMGPVQRAWQRP